MSTNIEQNTSKTEYKDDIPNTPIRFIWYVTTQFKGIAFMAVVAVIFGSGLGQATSYIFKIIVDAAEAGHKERVIIAVLLYPFAVLIVQLFYRLSGIMGGKWVTRSIKYINDILVQYLLNHSHKYFTDRFSGSLMSKVNNVVHAVDKFIQDFLWSILTAFVSFSVTFVFIWRTDVRSGIIFAALFVVLIIINRFLGKKKRALSYHESELRTKLRGTIVDIFTNISAVRQYVRVGDESKKVFESSEEERQAGWRSWLYSETMNTINVFLLFVFSLVMFYFIAERWMHGDIGTGDFVFILSLYTHVTTSLLFIGRALNNTARAFGEIEEGLSEILQPIGIVDTPNAMVLELSQKSGISWESVGFAYEEGAVFKDFNLTISHGERIGLVGSSGAGKTTFVSLMLRQHELDEGAILIDGQDIATVTQDSLRKNMAIVPQEPLLFHRSIRENIVYGKPDATDVEVVEVAKKAQAHEFISLLSHGYDTLVGERGIKLSGGQKQRIAIARAMLKNAPILVLDEATSALDSESEVAIQKALHELMEGKTVIAIAHRLSTLREMDRIIVLEQGKIVEDGAHDDLVKQGGIYSRLWEHQAGGFLQE